MKPLELLQDAAVAPSASVPEPSANATACKQVISNPAFYLEPEYAKLFSQPTHQALFLKLFFDGMAIL